MILIMFIFALSGATIAAAVVHAVIQLLRSDKALKKTQHRHLNQKRKTLIDISTTCKFIRNADDNNTKEKLLAELAEIRRWIERYY